MKKISAWIGLLFGVSLFAPTASAQAPAKTWEPDRFVELIIGNAPGGALDRVGRLVQAIIQKNNLIKQPVNVVSKPGGGQTIAVGYMNNHAGDAHYIAFLNLSWVASLAGRKEIAGLGEVTPLMNLLSNDLAYVVAADSPIKAPGDIVERIKKDPSSISFALASALGNPNHVGVAELAQYVGVDPTKLKVVAFDSAGTVSTQVAGGHIDVGLTSISSAMSLIDAKKIRAVAIAGPERGAGFLATIPTFKEAGFNVVSRSSTFMVGPKGMTPEQIAFWNGVMAKVVATDEFEKFLQSEFFARDTDTVGSKLKTALNQWYDELAKSPVAIAGAN